MTHAAPPPLDWSGVDLVVFDLDGTLYDANRLRALMGAWLLADALRRGRLDRLRALAAFRRVREALGEASARGPVAFDALQYRLAAQQVGCAPDAVRAWVEDWMERRPLRWLGACRRRGARELFAGLRRAGKQVAVWSDHPARAKLQALGLEADAVVWAGDAQVGRLKPDPRGLQVLLQRCGVSPGRALMVGDRADRDVAAAERAGVRALLLLRPGLRAWRQRHAHLPVGTRVCRGFEDEVFDALRLPGRWASA